MHTVLYALELVVFIFAILALCIFVTRRLSATKLPPGAVVLVTGGSRGLGLAIASRFAKNHKTRLVLASRHIDELQQAQATLLARFPHLAADDFLLVAADLAKPEECQRLVAETIARFGRIDVLVNNAAIIEIGPAEIMPASAFEAAMQINFYAAFYTTWAALPHLQRQSSLPGTTGSERRAVIVNIASVGGKIAVPHMLPYTAAKFALVGFSEGLHAELHKSDILVTTVCPGLMRSGGEDHAKFIGDVEAEKRWFMFAATTPGITTTVTHAANKIFRAVTLNRAEITITPQAWLAARFGGLCPETLQLANALTNRFVLPGPPKS
jgi:NAD(P)-dependent dehydrogenase (short-subunit alcohol dehydrogenase family)